MEKKNWFLTYRRALIYKGYLFACRVHRKLCKEYNKLLKKEYVDDVEVKKILLYPLFNDKEKLADVLNRIQCAIPEDNNKGLKIDIIVSTDLIGLDINELETPKFQARYLKPSDKVNFVSVKGKIAYVEYDKIVIHSYKSLLNINILFNLSKTIIFDKKFYSFVETILIFYLHFQTVSESKKKKAGKISDNKFAILEQKFQNNKKAYCFCTGPYFSRYKEFEYEKDAVKIICNSVVENREFLNHIGGPDILTFADSVFHLGSSIYATNFRDKVVEISELYPEMTIIVPKYCLPLLLNNIPKIKGKVIGIGLHFNDMMNIPSSSNLISKSTINILTLCMLPVAYALAKEVYIIGADGRHKSENYFWKHNPSVQLTDQMRSVFKTHPSFFRDRNYQKYYDRHCNFLKDLILFGEENGKSVFSLTPSLIPALKNRCFSMEQEQSKRFEI